jgi:putative polyketide hydroxylase
VLLAGPAADKWLVAAERLDLLVDAYRVGEDLEDPEGHFPKKYGITDEGAVLIRPDGFVAWRAETNEGDLESAVNKILSRT